eukprot:TRINITY_DN45895_c0_g1_i1.p1 TRINITY_DN45895_c0_g1~~TRINITY_DN45895_c0_g1_i1.p1  ORF type:complete len:206 (+),score=64.01 TRINITY_DN45895_c0_g1_i1:67-684(+)
MTRRPPRSTLSSSSAASDVYKRQEMDSAWMEQALAEAERALTQGEVPVGCVFVREGEVIGRGANETNVAKNGTRHAEFVASDQILAAHGGDAAVFESCTLYVTVEPCVMCAAALHLLKVPRIVFGARNDHFGGCGTVFDVQQLSKLPEKDSAKLVAGVGEQAAIELLQRFYLSLIHISEPTRLLSISYAVFCLKKKKRPICISTY